MLSYWEQQHFLRYDHIVIGAGIVGLSVAIELAEKYAGERVLVLERGLLPTGASTRNAGFACMGSPTELLDDLGRMSEDEVVALFERRKQGLGLLRARLGDAGIGYRANGSYELISSEELDVLGELERLNRLLWPVLQQPAYGVANDRIKVFGFSSSYTKALIANSCEGELDTGRMMRTLVDFALSKGIEIKTGALVEGFEEEDGQVSVLVADGTRGNRLELRGRSLCICTNAFTRQLLPGEDVVPGRGQVVLTKPVDGLRFKGIFHLDKGYYYFREIDGRVLLGGGRNLDFEGETVDRFGETPLVMNRLRALLEEVILPGTPFEIDRQWSGIMAFGRQKLPIVKQVSDRVYGAFRMGGMGVALGSKVAQELVGMMEV